MNHPNINAYSYPDFIYIYIYISLLIVKFITIQMNIQDSNKIKGYKTQYSYNLNEYKIKTSN